MTDWRRNFCYAVNACCWKTPAETVFCRPLPGTAVPVFLILGMRKRTLLSQKPFLWLFQCWCKDKAYQPNPKGVKPTLTEERDQACKLDFTLQKRWGTPWTGCQSVTGITQRKTAIPVSTTGKNKHSLISWQLVDGGCWQSLEENVCNELYGVSMTTLMWSPADCCSRP